MKRKADTKKAVPIRTLKRWLERLPMELREADMRVPHVATQAYNAHVLTVKSWYQWVDKRIKAYAKKGVCNE